MLRKETRSLFKGKYQYKIVLICAGAQWFRSGNPEVILFHLHNITVSKSPQYHSRRPSIRTQEDLGYAFALQAALAKMSNIDIRVEAPWISIYTNSEADINTLADLDKEKVKYICEPPKNINLEPGVIVMPKIDFDYKVTLGKSTQNLAFLEWAHKTPKVLMTKSCDRALRKERDWGGTHFYVTGDNNLLLVKMHLGGSIARIDRIVKA